MNAAKALFLALLLGWVFPALADVAVPPLVGRVVDLTGTLSTNDVSAMNQTIRAFEARKGSQVAVLIVPSTDGEAIEPFSLRVAEAWKIGRKKIDDGVLLVIAKNDRKLRIEVGYGLEGALTDVTSKRIIDEIITPHFRSGDFAGGISAGVDRIIRIIDGEKLPAPAQREPSRGTQPSWLTEHIDPFNPFVIFAVFRRWRHHADLAWQARRGGGDRQRRRNSGMVLRSVAAAVHRRRPHRFLRRAVGRFRKQHRRRPGQQQRLVGRQQSQQRLVEQFRRFERQRRRGRQFRRRRRVR